MTEHLIIRPDAERMKHQHDLPVAKDYEVDTLAACSGCGRWFFRWNIVVRDRSVAEWIPVRWWNRKYRRRIAERMSS